MSGKIKRRIGRCLDGRGQNGSRSRLPDRVRRGERQDGKHQDWQGYLVGTWGTWGPPGALALQTFRHSFRQSGWHLQVSRRWLWLGPHYLPNYASSAFSLTTPAQAPGMTPDGPLSSKSHPSLTIPCPGGPSRPDLMLQRLQRYSLGGPLLRACITRALALRYLSTRLDTAAKTRTSAAGSC